MIVLLAACSLLAGCDEDKRLAQMANENAQRQAEQNQEMARLNREVAEGSKRLVTANAEANDKLLSAQQKLDDQRTQIDAQRQVLADERHRESILGPLLTTLGTLLVCALPLVLCWFLLHGLRQGGQEADLSQLLVEEIVADQPTLLPAPPHRDAIDQHDLPALENGPRSTG
jgi:multidrug efflux pump subunit AcrA (membrane-fusion protein)